MNINNISQSCLLWADDLLILSLSERGLQNAINKMGDFYSSLGLEVNIKKTKVIVFNKSGKLLKNINCYIFGKQIEVVKEYQYLGIKFCPGGSMTLAVEELAWKANKAWFSISSILYKNKRMSVDRAFKIFDSLVTPVALYACEFWLPHILPKKCFESEDNLLNFWGNF